MTNQAVKDLTEEAERLAEKLSGKCTALTDSTLDIPDSEVCCHHPRLADVVGSTGNLVSLNTTMIVSLYRAVMDPASTKPGTTKVPGPNCVKFMGLKVYGIESVRTLLAFLLVVSFLFSNVYLILRVNGIDPFSAFAK